MRRLLQIKLNRVDFGDLIGLFNVCRNDSGDIEKYPVVNKLESFWTGNFQTFSGYEVYDSSRQLLGTIRFAEYSDCTVITFYVNNDHHTKTFLEVIELMIADIKFVGFIVLGIREFSEDKMNVDIETRSDLPKTKAALKRWRDAYNIIRIMQDEAANSDDLEIYIPKLADFSDRIKSVLGKHYCEKTISKIKKAGEAGLLD